mmetsp:Transcript_17875/g.29336  ORF Transcript_17875/g.29336 Transcript_17875/m.29336 type:complete len:252 (+) Transcript_17875:77-832(+)
MTTATITSSYTGFTSSFVDRIATSRRRLDQYVETNKQKADDLVAKLKSCEADEQSKIDSLLRQLKSLQYERGVAEGANKSTSGPDGVTGVAEQRKKLETKQAKLQQEVEMLQSKNRMEQSRLEEVLAKEKEVREQAQEVRAKKIEIEAQRGMTLEDLTKGLLNYKYTGLTFQKGDNGALNFKFTKLDYNQPDKPFTFALVLDPDTDLYEIKDCNLRLNQKDIDEVVNVLNADKNGFNGLVVRMRKLFKETL